MKNLLIIYPHWPPSNLAGVHRPRLITNYIHLYGWHPIVITVKPEYYEEKHDWDLCKTVSPETEVHYVDAFKINKPRLIGDIGLRSFVQIYRKAKSLIKEKKIHFVWVPIPSFYMALMGRLLYEKFKVPYGIDYIDPWVRDISGRKDWRHRISNLLAGLLEPIAIKKTALITGVSEEYYKPALLRNFKEENIHPPFDIESTTGAKDKNDKKKPIKQINLPRQQVGKPCNQTIIHYAFPYGFDPHDHEIELEDLVRPWDHIENCKPLVYAGAFLPNSRLFIDALFEAIKRMIDKGQWQECFHLFFLGTGNYQGKRISEYAKTHGIEKYVHEIRDRFPFLHVLNFLSNAYGVLVIGSTEKHYTASKTFQSILSKRPVYSIFYQGSSAAQIMMETSSNKYHISWKEGMGMEAFINELRKKMSVFLSAKMVDTNDLQTMERFSSKYLSQKFAKRINLMSIK